MVSADLADTAPLVASDPLPPSLTIEMSAKLVRVAVTPASERIPDVVPIPVGASLTFGRSKDCDVFLDSKTSV